jgi:hypothetical protein
VVTVPGRARPPGTAKAKGLGIALTDTRPRRPTGAVARPIVGPEIRVQRAQEAGSATAIANALRINPGARRFLWYCSLCVRPPPVPLQEVGMEKITGKARARFRWILSCAIIGLSVSPCYAQGTPQEREQLLRRQEQLRLLEKRREEAEEARLKLEEARRKAACEPREGILLQNPVLRRCY